MGSQTTAELVREWIGTIAGLFGAIGVLVISLWGRTMRWRDKRKKKWPISPILSQIAAEYRTWNKLLVVTVSGHLESKVGLVKVEKVSLGYRRLNQCESRTEVIHDLNAVKLLGKEFRRKTSFEDLIFQFDSPDDISGSTIEVNLYVIGDADECVSNRVAGVVTRKEKPKEKP